MTVYKSIDKFPDYATKKQKTRLGNICEAYKAANAAADVCHLADKPQYLVSSLALPQLDNKQKYQVTMQPCGHLASITNEQVKFLDAHDVE